MSSQRIKTAAIILPPVIIALWLGGIWAIVLSLIAYVGICYEFLSFTTPFSSSRKIQFLGVLLILPLSYLFQGLPGLCCGIGLASILMFALALRTVEGENHFSPTDRWQPALQGSIVYPGFLGTVLVIACDIVPGPVLVWTLLVIAACDTAAYYGGSALRGVALSPRVSPNKTVSGLCCGLLFATFIGTLLAPLLLWSNSTCAIPNIGVFPGMKLIRIFSLNQPSWSVAALIAVMVALFGVIGDLSESLVKRTYGVKDTGSILPGHGGILDRIDAILFAIPAIVYANLMVLCQ